jgi:hypothetical protein
MRGRLATAWASASESEFGVGGRHYSGLFGQRQPILRGNHETGPTIVVHLNIADG